MPRPARPWFRFYVEAMRDPKMRRLTPAQRWLWVAILSAARESCEPGRLVIAPGVPMTESDLADYAGMRRPEVMDGLAVMLELGMVVEDVVTWVVPAWNDRQYESDNTTERTRKHRSKEQGRNVPTTPVGTPPETEAETDTENPPSRPPRKQRPHPDFEPTDNHRAYALERGLDIDDQRDRWITHCEAKGTTYANLNSGFATWLHRAVDFGQGGKPVATFAELTGRAEPKVCGQCANTGHYFDKQGEFVECSHGRVA
jgi:hypothetical protein